MLSVTVENQKRADERIPLFLQIPCQLKTLTVAPILEEITLEKYLQTGKIAGVSIGGETGYNSPIRPADYSWFVKLHEECKKYQIDYNVFSTGTTFIKDGRTYKIPREHEFSQAAKMNLDLNYRGIYKGEEDGRN